MSRKTGIFLYNGIPLSVEYEMNWVSPSEKWDTGAQTDCEIYSVCLEGGSDDLIEFMLELDPNSIDELSRIVIDYEEDNDGMSFLEDIQEFS
jgi:hypothetical protein